MSNFFEKYLKTIAAKFKHKGTSEIGYRTHFEQMLEGIFESINVKRIDHDAKAVDGNRPDFIVVKHDVPILYIETKYIGESLDKIEKSEQMARYFGYANLILTDYVEFRFYRNGIKYEEPIKIAEYSLTHRTINPLPDNFEHLQKSIIDFTQTHKEPIRTAEHLSKIMGGKAQRIRDNVKQFLANNSSKDASILRIYESIKKYLVHDLDIDSFADMYAQTLVYGLFVARYYDETPDNFTRQEARDLVPASNPFLRHFFDHITGPDFEKRLEYIVDELCVVFSHANVQKLTKQYFKDDLWGKTHAGPDPVIHFYEDFLKEYDPALRKKMGAFYTPLPVVRFIIRTVDYLLEKDFGLAGLADSSKLPNGKHRVQILDPAAGTGTFISAAIRTIYKSLREAGQEGRWHTYVHHDLLPRLHGFEIMMAPYTIAHLKLSMVFKQTGFWKFHRRLGIYLTNSLEESEILGDLFTGFGFSESIAQESKEASKIKNDTPIMVVIGNPPYSVSSNNKSDWILNLIKAYKKDLNERNIQPLSDDYIKFIRFSEYFIEKNGTGIVAMITNNSFLDGVIHRQMRKHLLETFDDIYIVDLHGNSKRKEKTLDGGKDENVFDIQQGVSINIFIRKSIKKNKLGNIFYSELYGSRASKFKALDGNDLSKIKWNRLEYSAPYFFFVPKNFKQEEQYDNFIPINKLFNKISSGIKTHRDHFIIGFNKKELRSKLDKFADEGLSDTQVANVLSLNDTRDWKLGLARESFYKVGFENIYYNYLWRPLDFRIIYYSSTLIELPRTDVLGHMIKGNNLSLCVSRKIDKQSWDDVFVTDKLSDVHCASGQTYILPLYLYLEDGTRYANLNKDIIKTIEKITGKVNPEDIIDYIYAILYSPSYREKYKEFLKIDFPRIPYPKDKNEFKKYVKFGNELRLLHLIESPKLNKYITTYSIEGTDTVDKITYRDGNVYINTEQYFGKVPEIAWNFYIGGYQPAQKWLKDRKGRTLTNEDIEHYQKIIIVLTETDRIMKEIG